MPPYLSPVLRFSPTMTISPPSPCEVHYGRAYVRSVPFVWRGVKLAGGARVCWPGSPGGRRRRCVSHKSSRGRTLPAARPTRVGSLEPRKRPLLKLPRAHIEAMPAL